MSIKIFVDTSITDLNLFGNSPSGLKIASASSGFAVSASVGVGYFSKNAAMVLCLTFHDDTRDMSTHATSSCHEAWQCLALARRYETYGCRVFVTKEAIEEAAKNNELFGDESSERKPLTLSTVRDAFPKMQTVNESRQIATDAREKFLWQPFAAATSEDVPVVEEDEVEEEK